MNIHFIGVGGIGISALAQYYLIKGNKVSGSDLVSSEIIDVLKKAKAKISLGPHRKTNIPKGTDLVVYSPAVQRDNTEFVEAKSRGIKTLSYPQALGKLTKEYFTIAVSGTHGKSTTCSMLSLILIEAGLDPTVVIGTKLKEFNDSNFRMGKSKYLIIEGDEWQASFLNYWPKIIVLTNIEREHLDYYKDINHILKTYQEYVSHLSKKDLLVYNKEDKNILKIDNKAGSKSFSLKQKEATKLKAILNIPGEHNVCNALAALTVARSLNISDDVSFKALAKYRGAWRRFQFQKKEINGREYTVINDYGHHPTEIRATLKATREKFPKDKIWCIFQPHQYQRTFHLFNDFAKVFSEAPVDKLIITDIFDVAGREKSDIKEKVSSKKLVEKLKLSHIKYMSKYQVKNYLKKNLKGGEIIIIMGAGDVYKILDTI